MIGTNEAAMRIWYVISLISIFVLFYADMAFASSLTIEGHPRFEVKQEGENWRISGAYEIVNNGDETARNVFPNLELGAWRWVGEPKTLAMNETAVWNLNEVLPREKLACVAGDNCAGQALPDRGLFPLLIRRHYEDTNSYQFSAAEVVDLTLGELTNEALVASRARPIVAKLAIDDDGDDIDAKLELKNISPSPKKISVSYFTSREIEVITPPQTIELAGGGVNVSDAEFRNFSGLEGSSYATFAVLQWEEFGVRNSLAVSGILRIEKPKHTSLLLGLVTGTIVVSILLIYVFVLKPRNKRLTQGT